MCGPAPGWALRVTPRPGQLFKGKFHYCEGADTRNISTRAECRAAHYRWVRRKYNFDNLGQVGGAGRVERGAPGAVRGVAAGPQRGRGWRGGCPQGFCGAGGDALTLAAQALMSLFVLSSKDGWVNIMYDGLDAVGIDRQVRGRRTAWPCARTPL